MKHSDSPRNEHGGPHLNGSQPERPYWKRMHHSGFFWVAVVFILLAMGIFVMTDGFLFRPGRAQETPVPAITH